MGRRTKTHHFIDDVAGSKLNDPGNSVANFPQRVFELFDVDPGMVFQFDVENRLFRAADH